MSETHCIDDDDDETTPFSYRILDSRRLAVNTSRRGFCTGFGESARSLSPAHLQQRLGIPFLLHIQTAPFSRINLSFEINVQPEQDQNSTTWWQSSHSSDGSRRRHHADRIITEIMGRFVYLLWCPKGRFIYQTWEGGRVGTDCSGENELCGTLLLSNFQVYRHIKVISVSARVYIPSGYCIFNSQSYISCVRRPAPSTRIKFKYMKRLNPENNRGIRNVLLPTPQATAPACTSAETVSRSACTL